MRIYRVNHTDVMGITISEQFFNSKNKAKKELRKKFKELKPNIAMDGDSENLSEPIMHRKQSHINGKSKKSFELMFEVWHKCNHEYEEWDTYIEILYIDLIRVS